jgi:predicted amidohydrolase
MKVACIQYTASSDWRHDVETALRLLDEAVGQGAELVVLPENCAGVGTIDGILTVAAFNEEEHPVLAAFSQFASKNRIELIVGSVGTLAGDGRRFNSSFMLRANGEIAARYDKIHLCDIDLPDRQIRESAVVAPGKQLVTAFSKAGVLGLSICYDLRFPHIYRRYAQAGASVLTVGAAFTRHTGRAHWDTLIRARAIETGCFVLAAGQCGQFDNGLELYGHSMIVDPWGRVLAEAGDEPAVITASIDPSLVAEARQNVPAWSLQVSDEAERIPLTGDRSPHPVA